MNLSIVTFFGNAAKRSVACSEMTHRDVACSGMTHYLKFANVLPWQSYFVERGGRGPRSYREYLIICAETKKTVHQTNLVSRDKQFRNIKNLYKLQNRGINLKILPVQTASFGGGTLPRKVFGGVGH